MAPDPKNRRVRDVPADEYLGCLNCSLGAHGGAIDAARRASIARTIRNCLMYGEIDLARTIRDGERDHPPYRLGLP